MTQLDDIEDKVLDLNDIEVESIDAGLFYLQQLKESGEELDPNGKFKRSLDKLVDGGVADGVDGAINSLNRSKESKEKFSNKQISKDQLDTLMEDYKKALEEENGDKEAAFKRVVERNPNLADKNIRRFLETQTKLKNEKTIAEEGVVIEEKPEDKSKVETETVVKEEVVVDEKVKEDVKLVKGKIRDLSRRVAQEVGVSEADKETISRIETEMEKIINGSEIRSDEEKINDLARAAARGEISQLEYKVKIKAITLELKKWASEHQEEVDSYLTERFVEEVKKENRTITKEQEEAVRIKKRLSSKVIHLDKELEAQESLILEKNKDKSRGETENAINNWKVMSGYPKMSVEETNKILEEDERVNVILGGLKLPNDPEVAAFDRVNAVLRKDKEVRGALERIQRKRALFGETKVNMYRFMGGQRKIGSQQNQNIERSIKMFTGNSLGDAMGRVYAGMANGGGMRLGLMGNISNGLKNLSATTGGFLKKSLGDLGSRLGPGIRKGLGNGITRLGGGFLKGVNGLGGALSSIGGFKVKAAVVVSTGVLIAIILSTVFLGNQNTMLNIMGSGWMWSEDAVEGNVSTVYEGGEDN